MSEHTATINWLRTEESFEYETYSRDHTISFATSQITGSAAETFFGSPEHVDPEELLVASLSSCHLLTFLAIAAKKGFTVDQYKDSPKGFLEKNEQGRMALERIELNPQITFSGEKVPTTEQIQRLHNSAHRACFIANSIRANVTINS